ncbi:MAG: hypothetical protein A2017_18325 [Lentisphaerae bacterium GWF2_44_16]|nr:MAG: hypothetical protein A2017_18325 [Lentisphaerae bacterium GWF2_44_16]
MQHEQIYELYKKYVMPTHLPDILFVRGEGTYLWDDKGKRYMDFGAGISVCNLGHCHPALVEAISKQAAKLVHISNLYMNENQPALAEKLIKHGFDGAVFFSNSGAEANEGLIKFARKWGNSQGKNEIIAMEDSFHGRTLATLAATGRSKYREGFGPDMPGFKFVPFNDINAIKNAVTDKTAAIMLEPVQGEGGIIPAHPDYLRAVRQFCTEKGILLMFDEVQCGMGRTGYFYAYQGYGVEPDALSLAKALGNGYPIGAFIVRREFVGTFTAGTHASTFGGSPLACAAACAVIDTMHKEKVLANCIKQGRYLRQKLEELKSKHSCILEIRIRGLMAGAVLEFPAKNILNLLRDAGLIALSAGENVLRLLPPLNVSSAEIDSAVQIIDTTLSGLKKQ